MNTYELSLKEMQRQVSDFMYCAQQECPKKPTMPNVSIRDLRTRLIGEEAQELQEALDKEDLVETYDALLDLLYVTIGTAVALGLDLEEGWLEVQRSNMSKFFGGRLREDGKWLKGPCHSAPQLKPIIEKQMQ